MKIALTWKPVSMLKLTHTSASCKATYIIPAAIVKELKVENNTCDNKITFR